MNNICPIHKIPRSPIKDGRLRCRPCYAQRQRDYFSRIDSDPFAKRRRQIRRACYKYGITISEFVALWNAQQGKCAICAKPFGIRLPYIDHSHATLEVRGMLCNACNMGLGLFYDDPRLLRAAAEYVVKSGLPF